MSAKSTSVLVLGALASLATACSGRDVPGLIGSMQDFASLNAVFVLVSLVSCFLLGRRTGLYGWPALLTGILLIHPRWTVSPSHGDCGFMMVNIALIFSLVAALAFAFQMRAAVKARRATRSHA